MKKIFFMVLVVTMFLPAGLVSADMQWENISPAGILEVNDILITEKESAIYIATSQGIFKTKDKGNSWELVLKTKDVFFLLEDKGGFLYALTKDILYFSDNYGLNWKRLYRSSRGSDNPLTTLTVTEQGHLYLGTCKGLVFSKDKGRSWQRISSKLGHLKIIRLLYNAYQDMVYVISEKGVYRFRSENESYERIFIHSSYKENLTETDQQEETADLNYINDLKIDKMGNLYIATKKGVMISKDMGRTYHLLNDSGLLNKNVSLLFIKNSFLYAINPKGIFLYGEDFWKEISLRLPPLYIRDLEQENSGNFYVATERGLFRSKESDFSSELFSHYDLNKLFKDEPDIAEIQKKALAYAGIVQPQVIQQHRNLARIKAILPTLKVDYDKTITSHSNVNFTRFATGPLDWGVSLTWNLSDLVWSEQQRLIDSQTRLLIELRNDLLDEVNKLYFERLRIKKELLSSDLKADKRIEKIIKLKELTASLDALTDGYFSNCLKETK